MAKKPTIPCANCGRLMWKSRRNLPAGLATCRPCRRSIADRTPAKHFTPEQRFCRACTMPFETRAATQHYCSTHCRTMPGRTSSLGYGYTHQQARAAWQLIIDANGGIGCGLCGQWIDATEPWHLDHTPDRSGYRGAAHARCNLSDGGKRAAQEWTGWQHLGIDRHPCPVCTTTVTWAAQRCCSKDCALELRRRERPPKPAKPSPPPKPPTYCTDCTALIQRGKRCDKCRAELNRTQARNAYRQRVGIPLDAPLDRRGAPRKVGVVL